MLNVLLIFLPSMGFEYCHYGLETGIYDTNQRAVASRSCYVQSRFDVLWRDSISLCMLIVMNPVLLEVHR